tara:strand:+ start:1943 stop:2524 length:582 start_codon:yes stop_codon:yes gene_type:complete
MPNSSALHFPDYQSFSDSIAVLSLPISSSELHGVMCGYLCADSSAKGEAYLQALIINQQESAKKTGILALFDVYTVSQQQISNLDFQFEMMLPPDHEALAERARAFGEWCEGFTQALVMAGVDYERVQEEETWNAIQHITEFAQLDYDTLHIDDDEEERALMEVSEYARMAVLSIHTELKQKTEAEQTTQVAH